MKEINKNPLTSKNIQLSFRSLEGNGNVNVITNSILFPDISNLSEITIMNNDGNTTITNVNQFAIEDFEKIIIQSKYVSIEDGHGLYSKLELGNSLIIQLYDKGKVISTLNDEQSLHFEKVSFVKIQSEQPIEILTRQPEIQINGDTTIYEPKGAKLFPLIRYDAKNLQVSGNVTLSLFMSDTYNFAKTINVEGLTERSPPLLKSEDYSLQLNISEPINLHVFLIPFLLIPFLIAAVFLVYNPIKK